MHVLSYTEKERGSEWHLSSGNFGLALDEMVGVLSCTWTVGMGDCVGGGGSDDDGCGSPSGDGDGVGLIAPAGVGVGVGVVAARGRETSDLRNVRDSPELSFSRFQGA